MSSHVDLVYSGLLIANTHADQLVEEENNCSYGRIISVSFGAIAPGQATGCLYENSPHIG